MQESSVHMINDDEYTLRHEDADISMARQCKTNMNAAYSD